MTAPETVLIAIVGYRNARDINSCLHSLGRLDEHRFCVAICENGGVEGFEALVAGLQDCVVFDASSAAVDGMDSSMRFGALQPHGQPVRIYLSSRNSGYAGGINHVLRHAGVEPAWNAIWILNADTEPDCHALSALISRAREGYSIVGSRLVFAASRRVQSYGGRWRPRLGRGLSVGMYAPQDAAADQDAISRELDYVSGASMFVTKQYVDEVGLLDERYFLYCEEVDWCLRRRAHHRIGYAHGSLVLHAHGTTIGSSSNRKKRSALSVYLDERNKLLLTRRFYPATYPFTIFIALLLTLQYVKAGAFRNFRVAVAGWWAGVRGEEGAPARFL
jgi:GT2 family glycosyltransferase